MLAKELRIANGEWRLANAYTLPALARSSVNSSGLLAAKRGRTIGLEPMPSGFTDRCSAVFELCPPQMLPSGFEPESRTDPVLARYKPAVLSS